MDIEMENLYSGTILRINLSNGKVSREPTVPYARRFLGGRGINVKLLYDALFPGTDPLDPANPLIFGAGPLCGTSAPASRVEVTAKSPETGFLGSSNFGGYFGPEMKFAGYDHLVITGKSEKPVYLLIADDRVEIRDAAHLWGKDTYQTQETIRSELDSKVRIACIGPAGEKLVRFATIQHELGHAASRTGMGSVMGSKNLKAVAVRGTQRVNIAQPDRFSEIVRRTQQAKGPRSADVNEQDEARFRLWDPDWKPVRSVGIRVKYNPASTGCYRCPTPCKDLYSAEVKGGGVIGCTFYTAPIYPVRNADLELALECGLLAQRYGIDVVSTMGIIAWLMELYERCIISSSDTDGVSMEWGSRPAIASIFEKIVNREGVGNVLAEGILPAARAIGRDSEHYANQVKGLPMYISFTPNRLIPCKGEALGMVVSRGDTMKTQVYAEYGQVFKKLAKLDDEVTAAKIRAGIQEITGTEEAAQSDAYNGKAELVAFIEDGVLIGDCLSVCKFWGGVFSNAAPVIGDFMDELMSAGLGYAVTRDELMSFAHRVKDLERAFNSREGMTRNTDSLPTRFTDIPVAAGDFRGSVMDSKEFERMKDRYYALRGWEIATGLPKPDVIRELAEKVTT